MPSSLFSLLAVLLMLLPINYPPARLTYQLTLTLTVITYKVRVRVRVRVRFSVSVSVRVRVRGTLTVIT